MAKYWFGHIHLFSPEPTKTAQFYEKMFNAKVLTTRKFPDGRLSVDLDLGGLRLLVAERRAGREAVASRSEVRHGLEHFGIETDNIEAAVAELKAKGTEFRDEIRLIRPGVKVAFLWAPENVLIEIVERKE